MHVCMCTCMCVYLCMNMYVCMCVCMYVYTPISHVLNGRPICPFKVGVTLIALILPCGGLASETARAGST